MPMAEVAKGLGQIHGLCAVTNRKTYNGRGYDEIYRRILDGQDFRFNEMMRRGGILCEFGHPDQYTADFERTETNPEKACAIITKIEEKEDGKIYADATILDTPAGRIYQAISPFYTFGFSSRGSYEPDENSLEGPDGWNQDSYIFKGFDIVALPATGESEISAMESIGSGRRKRKSKSARESLNLQNIADAANVDPKEVDAELDKLFAEDGSLAPVEYIDAHKFVEDVTDKTPAGSDTSSNVVLDLHKTLSEKADLEKRIQQYLFEKAESDAALLSLTAERDKLVKQLQDAQAQIDFYQKNKMEIDQLVEQLMSTHEAAIRQDDAALAQEQEKSKSLASQVAELKQQVAQATDEASSLYNQASREADTAAKLDTAQEQIKKLNASVESLRTQLTKSENSRKAAIAEADAAKKKAVAYNKIAIAARESLLDTYSTIYGIDRSVLALKVGKSGDVKFIKSAAESISNDVVRLSSYSSPVTPVKQSAPAAPSFPLQDDVDKELYDGLRKEGKL